MPPDETTAKNSGPCCECGDWTKRWDAEYGTWLCQDCRDEADLWGEAEQGK